MDRTYQIPVFPNRFPYNELLITGKLRGKTRSWEWKYRGPILLYTSLGNDLSVCKVYGLDPKQYSHKMIVAKANLVDVHHLSWDEAIEFLKAFNPGISKLKIASYRGSDWCGDEVIYPNNYGFFFEDITRLSQPIPYIWPRGAVTVSWVDQSELEPY